MTDEDRKLIVAQMIFLQSDDPERTSALHQLPGGDVDAGMAIYDTMQFIRPRRATICFGQATSMGA